MSAVPAHPPLRHLRPVRPLHFPESAEVPETKRHLRARTALYALLDRHFASVARIGSDQFVYLDASDPEAAVAPDAFLDLRGPDDSFDTWKIWERGAPELAVEIVSRSDRSPRRWRAKLALYRRAGIRELVRFDPNPRAPSLRVWDAIRGDLVERLIEGATTPCVTLGLHWLIASDGKERRLRLARDPRGMDLLPTEAENTAVVLELLNKERDEKYAARADAERERAEKQEALARVAELERRLRESQQG